MASASEIVSSGPFPPEGMSFGGVGCRAGDRCSKRYAHLEDSGAQAVHEIGDRTRELRGDDLRNLEYAKSNRHYEDEPNYDAEIDDLSEELLAKYLECVGAKGLPFQQVLKARGFIKRVNDKEYLSNAAVLLFARNIQQFYPNCRIRFLRYDGTYAGVGTKINIIKDMSIELPLLQIIDKTRDFIQTQLREFTMLNEQTGKFQIVPEYPEFAWLEGIVNAVAHREYALTGSFIKVSMYDDRLEIESPRT